MEYKVNAIPKAVASEVRRTRISPQYKSLAASASVANGYGPCRSCLRVFDEGRDRRIYLTYNSFDGRSPLPDPGPIFIHENECERFEKPGFPDQILDIPIYLEAFGDESVLVRRIKMNPAEVDEQIADLLCDVSVRFLNVRNAEAGCFIASVDRAGGKY